MCDNAGSVPPTFEKDVAFLTSYRDMNCSLPKISSNYPPGYTGHLGQTRFKYGYGNMGTDFEQHPHLKAERPSSRDGASYDERPVEHHAEGVFLRRCGHSTPDFRANKNMSMAGEQKLIQTALIKQFGPEAEKKNMEDLKDRRSKSCTNFYRTKEIGIPMYLRVKEPNAFPFYRPLGAKPGSLSPGSQFPAHPSPKFDLETYRFSTVWGEGVGKPHTAHLPKRLARAPSAWSHWTDGCSTGYRPNAAALFGVEWWQNKTAEPGHFNTTYRLEIDQGLNPNANDDSTEDGEEKEEEEKSEVEVCEFSG